jgi:hypothetical protein
MHEPFFERSFLARQFRFVPFMIRAAVYAVVVANSPREGVIAIYPTNRPNHATAVCTF